MKRLVLLSMTTTLFMCSCSASYANPSVIKKPSVEFDIGESHIEATMLAPICMLEYPFHLNKNTEIPFISLEKPLHPLMSVTTYSHVKPPDINRALCEYIKYPGFEANNYTFTGCHEKGEGISSGGVPLMCVKMLIGNTFFEVRRNSIYSPNYTVTIKS